MHAGDESIVSQIYLLSQPIVPQVHIVALRYERCVTRSCQYGIRGVHYTPPEQITLHRRRIEPLWRRRRAGMRRIAAPAPVSRALDHASPHRIKIDVATHLKQVRIGIGQYGFESRL